MLNGSLNIYNIFQYLKSWHNISLKEWLKFRKAYRSFIWQFLDLRQFVKLPCLLKNVSKIRFRAKFESLTKNVLMKYLTDTYVEF